MTSSVLSRDHPLSDHDLADYRRILDGVPLEGALTVFLSGSRAEGWSTSASNYNFYVVGPVPDSIRPIGGHSLPLLGRRVPSHHYMAGAERIMVQYWLAEDVDWVVDALRAHELHPTVEIWPPALRFLHRFGIGVPVLGGGWLEKRRQRIDFGLLARYLTQNRAMYAESYYTDAVSAIASGRPLDALLQARLALDCAVDAYLASLGDTNSQEKWRWRRLERLGDDNPLVRDYGAVLDGPGPGGDEDRLRSHLEAILQRCETLNCCVQLGCTYDEVTAHDGPRPTGDERPARTIGVRMARRYDGQVVVIGWNGQGAVLNPIAALVYGLADGRASTTLIARIAASRFAAERSAETVAAEARQAVRELTQRGILR